MHPGRGNDDTGTNKFADEEGELWHMHLCLASKEDGDKRAKRRCHHDDEYGGNSNVPATGIDGHAVAIQLVVCHDRSLSAFCWSRLALLSTIRKRRLSMVLDATSDGEPIQPRVRKGSYKTAAEKREDHLSEKPDKGRDTGSDPLDDGSRHKQAQVGYDSSRGRAN